MAALVEGQQYGLSAQDKINCTKSLVFVKLTDSALRSIEEYVKNKGDSISRPTIQFQNSNGVISLPQHGSSQNYGFTLSNVEADGPHGSFECLRQTGYRSLESLGCLQVKMHIHANEDSYENTRVKMAAVEKEQKKSCTKVIKPAGAHLGRKVKVKRPGLVVSPMKFSPPTASMASSKPLYAAPEAKAPPPPPKRPDMPKPSPPKKNPELMRQPIRDRIIHILAVRPYKRPELLVRLNHEGVREKDKNKLTSILPQLSTLKGNIYYLANFLWNEVQDNWKFCTQEELDIIRKRKQQHLNPSSANETPPSSSQPNSSPAQKRLSSEVIPNGNPRSKKQRISHYKGDPQRPSYNGTTELSTSTFFRKSPYSPSRSQPHTNSPDDESESFHPATRLLPDALSNGPSRLSPSIHSRTREDDKSSRLSPNVRREDDKSSRLSPNMRREDSRFSSSMRRDDDKSSRVSINPRTRDEDKGSRLSPPNARREDNNRLSSPSNGVRTNPNSRLSPHPMTKEDSRSRVPRPPPSRKDHPPPIPNGLKSSVNSNDGKILSQPPRPVVVDPKPQVSPDSNTPQFQKSEKTSSNGYVNNSITKNGYAGSQSSYISNGRSKVTSTTNGSCSNSPHSSCDSIEYNDTLQDEYLPAPTTDSPEQCDSPEYEKEYGRIVSGEQRAEYKAHFNAQYQEYLRLHEEIIAISNRFANWEKHLNTCREGSEDFKKIKSKIIKEYRAYQQDPHYIESLKKFNFLHNKLAHIKRLVAEYDNAPCARS